MRKISILFDLDDVLVKGGFLAIANEVFGANKTEDEITSYYVEENYDNISQEQKEMYLDELTRRNVYENSVVIEGAYELLKKYSEDKMIDVFIKSASVIHQREDDSAKLFADKYNLLRKIFPFIDPNNIILGGNTSLFQPDFYIDDKLINLVRSKARYKFLFTASHNKSESEEILAINNVVRVNSLYCFNNRVSVLMEYI